MDTDVSNFLYRLQQMVHNPRPHGISEEMTRAIKRKQIRLLIETLKERQRYLNVKGALLDLQNLSRGIIKEVSNELL